MALSKSLSSGCCSRSTSCSDSFSRISPASIRKSCRISSSASNAMGNPLYYSETETGYQIVYAILPRYYIFPLISLDLRTYTFFGRFFFFFNLVYGAGQLIHVAGHNHQAEQVFFNLFNQRGDLLDDLAGQILEILCQQYLRQVVVEAVRVFTQAAKKRVDAAIELAKFSEIGRASCRERE